MPTEIITDNTTGGDYTGTDDTCLKESQTSWQQGGKADFTLSNWSNTDRNHALIKFSGLSNIAGPVTVTGATLSLYLATYNDNSGSPGARDATFYRLLRNWVEGTTSGFDSGVGASWTYWDSAGTQAWTTAGCLGSATDRAASSSGVLSITNTISAYVDLTCSAGMLTDIQDWINGGASNYGWVATMGLIGNGDERIFTSSEGTDAQRPKLSVTYTASNNTTTAWIRA